MWFNRWNQKFDIGSGMNLHKRLKEYFYPSRLSNNRAINKALSKYGHHSFILMILYNFNSQVDRNLLLNKEQYYMDLFKPSYNMTKKAGNTQGFIFSLESRKKMSLARQKRIISEIINIIIKGSKKDLLFILSFSIK
jgi:group I intron endonuclease